MFGVQKLRFLTQQHTQCSGNANPVSRSWLAKVRREYLAGRQANYAELELPEHRDTSGIGTWVSTPSAVASL